MPNKFSKIALFVSDSVTSIYTNSNSKYCAIGLIVVARQTANRAAKRPSKGSDTLGWGICRCRVEVKERVSVEENRLASQSRHCRFQMWITLSKWPYSLHIRDVIYKSGESELCGLSRLFEQFDTFCLFGRAARFPVVGMYMSLAWGTPIEKQWIENPRLHGYSLPSAAKLR